MSPPFCDIGTGRSQDLVLSPYVNLFGLIMVHYQVNLLYRGLLKVRAKLRRSKQTPLSLFLLNCMSGGNTGLLSDMGLKRGPWASGRAAMLTSRYRKRLICSLCLYALVVKRQRVA